MDIGKKDLHYDYYLVNEDNKTLASKKVGEEPEIFFPEEAIQQLLFALRQSEDNASKISLELYRANEVISEGVRKIDRLQNDLKILQDTIKKVN